jgi:HlyD family type I secretion membrane fusion protein
MWSRPQSVRHAFADFLPDGEALVEARHSPIASLLVVLIALTFGGMLLWSALTEVERVVSAEGRVEPAARVKVINHPDGGRIAELHVVEGQAVRAGEPLLTFDGELVATELAEVTGRWQVRAAEATRLAAELALAEVKDDPALTLARPDLVLKQSELLERRRQSRASRQQSLAQAVERREGEVAMLGAELARLRRSQAMVEEQVGAVRALAEQGLYPRLRLTDAERQLADLAGDIRKTRAGLAAAEAAVGEATSALAGFEQEWQAATLAELAQAEAERDRLAEMRRRLAAVQRNLVLRAPVDGIVQELAIAGPGQSVGSNQPIMKLVPTDGGLVIEAQVANRDIGELRPGQPARIKVRAFDFLRYGVLAGTIERIAADARPDPASGELRYDVTLRSATAALQDGAHVVRVGPGMAVDVELLVGERTILSYLTDRIFRLPAQVFKEG